MNQLTINQAVVSYRTYRARHSRYDRKLPTCRTCERDGRRCAGYSKKSQHNHANVFDIPHPESGQSRETEVLFSTSTRRTDLQPVTMTNEDVDALLLIKKYFPENKTYGHIIELCNKAIELSCPVCHANCLANGEYFDGVFSFVAHVQTHEGYNAESPVAILKMTEDKGCLREVDKVDIDRIQSGEMPINVRKADHSTRPEADLVAKQKMRFAEGVARAKQPLHAFGSVGAKQHAEISDNYTNSSSTSNNFGESRRSFGERPSPGVRMTVPTQFYTSSNNRIIPNKGALKRQATDDRPVTSSNYIAPATTDGVAAKQASALQDLAINALGRIEPGGERSKRRRRSSYNIDDYDPSDGGEDEAMANVDDGDGEWTPGDNEDSSSLAYHRSKWTRDQAILGEALSTGTPLGFLTTLCDVPYDMSSSQVLVNVGGSAGC